MHLAVSVVLLSCLFANYVRDKWHLLGSFGPREHVNKILIVEKVFKNFDFNFAKTLVVEEPVDLFWDMAKANELLDKSLSMEAIEWIKWSPLSSCHLLLSKLIVKRIWMDFLLLEEFD
jgi:hypothetical protein